ncbi:MAG: OmpA family protein, partial [Bacteroidota bacterium]
KGNISCETDFANLPAGSEIELSHNLSDEILELSVPGVYSLPFVKRIADTSEIIDISVSLRAADISKLNNVSINLDDLPQYVVDLNLKNFEAILRFDYHSSELSPENQDLLRQLADKLPGGSTIQILGSADALGSAERNIQLERERAGNTKQYIEQIAGNKFTIKTDINIEKFPEATPQGRFLNRSIRIRADK